MATSSAFNPQMLLLARESRGFTQSALAQECAISQGHLSKIEAGLWPPGDDVLATLVRVLEFPPEFFFESASLFGPGVSEFFHRKRQDVSATVLKQAYARINLFLSHLSRLLRAVDIGPCAIPRFDRQDYKTVQEIARAVRAAWSMPPGPVESVVATIERAGGVVLRCDFGSPRIDAISRWAPGLPPVFFVNQDIPADRQRLTLCHELGHLVLHDAPVPEMEAEANAFAGEFLMPEREIKPYLGDVTLHRLASLKPYWRVSMAALLYRAAELNRISENSKRYLWSQMSKHGYKRREPPELDVPEEKPTLFQEILDLHTGELGYSAEHLAGLLVLRPDHLRRDYGVTSAPAERPRMRLIK
jgi:Zn-dependent peptidase ImmA (M78 family)/transcriptional regulator with XRE-family HTH domain